VNRRWKKALVWNDRILSLCTIYYTKNFIKIYHDAVWPRVTPEMIKIMFLYLQWYCTLLPQSNKSICTHFKHMLHIIWQKKYEEMSWSNKKLFLVTVHPGGHFKILFWHGAQSCSVLLWRTVFRKAILLFFFSHHK